MAVTEMIVGLSAGLFMLTAFVFFLRLIQAWMLHRTLRDAINRDSPMAGTIIERVGSGDLGAPQFGTHNDDRTGTILVALGIALAGFSIVVGDMGWLRYGLGAALFPLLVGAALLIRHMMLRRSAERDVAARS